MNLIKGREKMKYTILGGGLSALSLAYFLEQNNTTEEILIIEKEEKLGGLCRSFNIKGIAYDIGPHIIFSKNKEILGFMNELLKDNVEKHRRSNRIIYDKKFIQYPFENDLSKLPKHKLDYCLNSFLYNPYENYNPQSMLQFFLKTFGEGITNTYLRPYNEKIWKFDPAYMDTQMVERIPKPPKEDIIKSAKGETVDGYLHQLYFTYPKQEGMEALIKAFISKLSNKTKFILNSKIDKITKQNEVFNIETSSGNFEAEKIISTIPLNYLCGIYQNCPLEIKNVSCNLKHNSIMLCIFNVKKDYAKDNYAFMISDKNVIFHRISKLDFMGESYHIKNTVTYMAEITYRKNDLYDKMTNDEIIKKAAEGLKTIGFIDNEEDINFYDIKRFEYAYVIYDIEHKINTKKIREYFEKENILTNGRFGSFEYINMDAVINQSKMLAEKINSLI